jgi:hypothetical protein
MEAVYGDGKEKREEEGEENEEEEEGEEDSEGPRDRRFNCCCTADPSQRAMRNCSNCASPTRILYSLYSLSLILPICHSTFFFLPITLSLSYWWQDDVDSVKPPAGPIEAKWTTVEEVLPLSLSLPRARPLSLYEGLMLLHRLPSS